MVPSADRLPDVLPSARLLAGGQRVPEVRAALRRIPDTRNAWTVACAWGQAAAVVVAAVAVDRWWVWPVAAVLMGRSFAQLAILAHEAARAR